MIPRCAGHGPENLNPNKIAMRFLALNTMFVFAMSYVFAHAVMDLYGSPDRDEVVAGLVEECRRVASQQPNGRIGTREATDSLHRVDSAMRESMRISDTFVFSLFRDVMGTKPLDLGNPGIGLVPPGARLVWPSHAIHLDPDNYPDPTRFDAFRYSRPFEGQEGQAAEARETMTTLTPKWLAFGYGKRACPGRWFVAQTLKQALAHVVMNYDVEIVGKRPERKAILAIMTPPEDVKLRVRRKEQPKAT